MSTVIKETSPRPVIVEEVGGFVVFVKGRRWNCDGCLMPRCTGATTEAKYGPVKVRIVDVDRTVKSKCGIEKVVLTRTPETVVVD